MSAGMGVASLRLIPAGPEIGAATVRGPAGGRGGGAGAGWLLAARRPGWAQEQAAGWLQRWRASAGLRRRCSGPTSLLATPRSCWSTRCAPWGLLQLALALPAECPGQGGGRVDS